MHLRHAFGRRTCAAFLTALALAAGAACATQQPAPAGVTRETRERAYRANNLGVALLEQLNYADAAAAFRQALSIDDSLGIARLNLSLALLYEQDLDGAAAEAARAAERLPDAPQPPYVLGLVARAQGRNAEARGFFQKVLGIDRADVGATVNLAQIDLEDQRYDGAVAALEPIVQAEPYHVTATYVLGLALSRSGRGEEGERLLQRAQELRGAEYAVTFGTGYLEQGRYAEAIASTGAEPDLIDPGVPDAVFAGRALRTAGSALPGSPYGRTYTAADLTPSGTRDIAAGLGGGQAVADLDGDGTLELVVVSASGQRVYRRGGDGSFADVTGQVGLEAPAGDGVGIGVIAADYDNDGAVDLFVLRDRGSLLYHNDGKGRFSDATRRARLPAYPHLPGAAAFADVDHDGDVDLLIAGLADLGATRRQRGEWAFPAGFAPAPLQLLRNNGNGTFSDITRAARLDRRGHAVAVAPTDFDNHRDLDLLVVYRDGPPALFANQRDGTFRDVAPQVGLTVGLPEGGEVTAVALGDVNKDDWPDLFLGGARESVLALSNGRGRFEMSPAPPAVSGATAAQFVDYDLDGLLDLVAVNATGLAVARNVGVTWVDATGKAVPAQAMSGRPAVRSLAAADVDDDGDLDVVLNSGDSAWLFTNSGDARNHGLRVRLRGRVSNRLGVGSKVQIRAGSLSARAETSAATPAVGPSDLVFGLGVRPGADVTRVLWPSGILQAETAPGDGDARSLPSPFTVEELDRKPSSCPLLFTWNGERFEFVTDFLGGGEMGYWEGPAVYNHPDPLEYVRIRGDQLVAREGRLDLRVTNELEEVVYLDRVELMSVTHPADLEVYPNEGMTPTAKPHRLHAVRGAHVPVRVTDEHGHDVTDRVARLDRTYPDDFARAPLRGYAYPHSVTLDIGQVTAAQTLLLTGWTDYAFSSDNVAASQAGLAVREPMLEVRDRHGRWRTLDLAIGIPVGRPQTIPLDLTGLLAPGEHELRLTTTMRIYWDQIRVGDTAATDGLSVEVADPLMATLRVRGFSAEVRPDGQDPPTYDYARVSTQSPWKDFVGDFTRLGDVRTLLTAADDQFVIARTGDEVALAFPAPSAPPPAGWTRTYLLKGDGYSKEMDVNSARPDRVEPLPFHAMSGYPYPAAERYPDTPAHQRYRQDYNTRRVRRPLAPLVGTR